MNITNDKDKTYNFKTFLYENKWNILIACIFSLLCCFAMIYFKMINIDEETWYLSSDMEKSDMWLLQERYMIYIYNKIFSPCGRFIPYVSDCLGLIFWNISGVIFMYIFFEMFEIKSNFGRIVALCYYSSLPLCMGEAFGFGFMIIPETFAMVLVSISFVLFVRKKHNIINCSIEISILIIAMGVYQALVEMFIVAVVGWCVACQLKNKEWLKTAIKGAAVCIISFMVYYLINFVIKRYVGTASYLSDGYIGWGKENIIKTLFMACANVIRVTCGLNLMGKYVYGAWSLRCILILFIVAIIGRLKDANNTREKVLILLGAVLIITSPFFLYIAMGTYKTYGRMLLALSLSGAIEFLMIFQYMEKRKNNIKKFVCVISTVILILNCVYMNLLYYRGNKVYENDVVVANSIMNTIKEKGYDYENKPIVFCGKYGKSLEENGGSGTIGASFWNWDDCNMSRTRDFLEILGYDVTIPTEVQIDEALNLIDDMSVWPSESAVKETDDIIIVYLSKPSQKWIELNKSLVG